MREKKGEHKNTQIFYRPKIEFPLILVALTCVLLLITMPIWKPNTPGTITNFELYQMLGGDIRWALTLIGGVFVSTICIVASLIISRLDHIASKLK